MHETKERPHRHNAQGMIAELFGIPVIQADLQDARCASLEARSNIFLSKAPIRPRCRSGRLHEAGK